jgi:hypothetical protein
MPVTAICNATYEDPRQRQLFKNIMVLGALSVLMEVDAGVIEKLFSEQYRGKERLLESNVRALQAGCSFARDHLKPPIGLRVKHADAVGERIFVDGNAAAALGCVYGGATVCAWYPITPSSSVAEAFQKYCAKYRHDPVTKQARYAIVQAEDEIASIGIVTGAGWNGARAFTATSGPGVSRSRRCCTPAVWGGASPATRRGSRGGASVTNCWNAWPRPASSPVGSIASARSTTSWPIGSPAPDRCCAPITSSCAAGSSIPGSSPATGMAALTCAGSRKCGAPRRCWSEATLRT